MAITPKKRLGQNFLVDKGVVGDLVAAAELSEQDTVIEIGAGTGVLTKELAKKAGKVIAFEIDRDLMPILKKELGAFDNVKVINEDFLTTALYSAKELSKCKLVGSIPYQITSPLIHKLLALKPPPSLAVLLIQKEVAEKITARPPRATYLSNITKLLGEVEVVRFVPREAFWPVPEVDGAIIKLKVRSSRRANKLYKNSKFKVGDTVRFQKFLHRGFQHPRKMLRNKFDAEILKNAGIAPTQRAQCLSLEEWVNLSHLRYGIK